MIERFRSMSRDLIFRAIIFLSICIVAVGFAIGAFIHDQSKNNNPAASKAERNRPAVVGIDPRSVTDPNERIAEYTFWLMVFTGILGTVSIVQIFFLFSADKTTRNAADAAMKSAIVAERSLERTSAPYIDVVVSPKAIIHRFPSGNISAEFIDKNIFCEYVIHNYGESPAVILEIYHGCVRSAGLPEEIRFPPPQSNLMKVINVGGMKESAALAIGFPDGGIDTAAGRESVWICLQIRYRDIYWSQYISTYCGSYNSVSATFTAYGGPKYNDRRKLTEDELKIAQSRDE